MNRILSRCSRHLLLTVCALAVGVFSTINVVAGDLTAGFLSPPTPAKPQLWWHWLNGNISKQGIKADLEAMHRAGIGGAIIFNTECGIPEGNVPVLSPEWKEMIRFAAAEADRLGIELGVHNGPGWACSGGPWNTPENAMQVVVAREIRVQGPGRFSIRLPEPATRIDYLKDIAVLAFRTRGGDGPLMSEAQPNVAEVFVNGMSLGILWKPPFIVEATSAIKPGRNRLEVKTTNLWCNRLIGDEQLPDDMHWTTTGFWAPAGPEKWPDWLLEGKPRPLGRIGFATWRYFDKNTPLLESGLLGPERLHSAEKRILDC